MTLIMFFNNVLQAISGYCQLLMMNLNEDQKKYKFLKQIDISVERAGELTRQLLTFSRKLESQKRPTDLNHEVREIERLLRSTIPKMIDIELYLADDLSRIDADPVQMEQIMMNIAINSRDAMPDGGKLIFQTENIISDEEYIQTHYGVKARDMYGLPSLIPVMVWIRRQ